MNDVLERDPEDRIIIGLAAITDAINQMRVFDHELNVRQVHHLVIRGVVPAEKLGPRLRATTRRKITDKLSQS
jgi:hypothetical protein